jgi:hypothetical protein
MYVYIYEIAVCADVVLFTCNEFGHHSFLHEIYLCTSNYSKYNLNLGCLHPVACVRSR